MSQDTPIPPAEPIELRAIFHERGEMFAVFTIGPSWRVAACEIADVLTFEAFRRMVLDKFDQRTVYRGGQWNRDVVRAAERGASVKARAAA